MGNDIIAINEQHAIYQICSSCGNKIYIGERCEATTFGIINESGGFEMDLNDGWEFIKCAVCVEKTKNELLNKMDFIDEYDMQIITHLIKKTKKRAIDNGVSIRDKYVKITMLYDALSTLYKKFKLIEIDNTIHGYGMIINSDYDVKILNYVK